jgi:hypothetical protein
MAAHPGGRGYWLVAADGGLFAFGSVGFFGSAGGVRHGKRVVGMSATPTGNGYWMVAQRTPPPPPPPSLPPPAAQPPPPQQNCDPAYPDVCIPPPPPDLDCDDVPYENFTVRPPDPHGFDGDGDGVGCEA